MTRQREYQIRKKAEKKCIKCGKELFNKTYCVIHAEIAANNARDRYRNLALQQIANQFVSAEGISYEEAMSRARDIKGW